METATTIQETYNIWSWLLPLVSGAIGALIGNLWRFLFLTLETGEENQECASNGRESTQCI